MTLRRRGMCGFALLLITAAWLGAPMPVSAVPAVEYATTETLDDPRPFTLGYMFATSVPFDVSALGYWVDGLQDDHRVGIWHSIGTLLTSTTVLGTDPILGHFQYHAIPNLLLAAGTYTIAGEFLGSGATFPANAAGITTVSGYTWISDEQNFGPGLNFPTDEFGLYGENGILVVDFIVATVAVPGPATLVLLGTSLLGWLAPRARRG